MVSMVNHISVQKYRALLALISTTYLKACAHPSMEACLKRLECYESAQPFLCQIRTFTLYCRCIATLLQLRDVETDASSVQYFASYKGPGVFEKAIQSILTKEVDSQGKKVKAVVESRELIQKMFKDVVRTAASTKVQQPQFEAVMDALRSHSPKMAVLQEAWEKLPSFKTGLREGACKPLEDELVKVAKSKAEAILEETAKGKDGKLPKISSKDLNILLCVLKEFPKEAGIVDLQTKLMKWAKNHNSTLARNELENLLVDFIELNCQSAGKRGKFIAMDINVVREAVQKCGNKIPDTVGNLVHGAVYIYLKAAEDHAPLTQIYAPLLTLLNYWFCDV